MWVPACGDSQHPAQGAGHRGSCKAWCPPGPLAEVVPPWCPPSAMPVGQMLATARPEPSACEAPRVQCLAVLGDAITRLRRSAGVIAHPSSPGRR